MKDGKKEDCNWNTCHCNPARWSRLHLGRFLPRPPDAGNDCACNRRGGPTFVFIGILPHFHHHGLSSAESWANLLSVESWNSNLEHHSILLSISVEVWCIKWGKTDKICCGRKYLSRAFNQQAPVQSISWDAPTMCLFPSKSVESCVKPRNRPCKRIRTEKYKYRDLFIWSTVKTTAPCKALISAETKWWPGKSKRLIHWLWGQMLKRFHAAF